MYKAVFLTALSAFFLSCGMAQETASPMGQEHAGLQAIQDRPDAIYFITPDMKIPAGADMSRGDVPRDGYGRPYTYAYLGRQLPAFEGQLENGERFSSLSLQGSWAVIRIWGMWCHDSRGELDEAAELAGALHGLDGVNFMSIHVPQNAQTTGMALRGYESLSDFFEEAGYSYPTLMDQNAALRETLKIRWTPSYLVVAPDGSVQGFRTSLADAGQAGVETFVQDIRLTQETWTLKSSFEGLAE